MKKIALILVFCATNIAHAQSDTQWKIDGTSAIGSASNVVRLEGKEEVQVVTDLNGEAKGLTVGKYGDVKLPVTSMTPVAVYTPATGSYLKAGVNMIPTAAPTLSIVFVEPHKMVGATKLIISDSANPTLIHPLPNASSTPSSINAAGVGTPYSSAAGAVTECIGVSTSNARCRAR